MKKIIFVLITVAAFASVHAQSSRDKARRNILGQSKQTSSQSRTIVLGSPQRVYKTNRNVYYHRKTNHGKHLGWYKGVGNPHKYAWQSERGKKWDHNKGHGHGKHHD
jgi:hypothetical protein